MTAALAGGTRRKAAPAFRLTRPVVPEDALHASTVDLLTRLVLPPAEWACYPAGLTELTGQQKARLYRMGLRVGWPDFLIAFNGILGVELKTETGQLSRSRWVTTRDRRGNIVKRWVEGQRDVHPRLIASGGFQRIAVCRSVEEVEAELLAFGVPMRGRVAA
jgi:hypothetical protein